MLKSRLDNVLMPFRKFVEKKTSVGILLIISALAAMLIANSPWSDHYHHFWHQYLYIGFEDAVLKKNLLHWINDGLMSVFFFVVGLELKREILYGQLADVRRALLPIGAAVGGMVVPAAIYFAFNGGTDAASGWGIPMATDIAFALGILYLLGDKVPLSLKVLLTAIAIVDDLGAVLVIAFFYTSEISMYNLGMAGVFLSILIVANYIGIRNVFFYVIVGIGGLWMAVMLSGVHATIAAVLAAFTIPTSKRIGTNVFLKKVGLLSAEVKKLRSRLTKEDSEGKEKVMSTMEKFSYLTEEAVPPLQRLEHGLHNLVSFVVLPVFAFANAGVTIKGGSFEIFTSPVALGVILGLVFGKIGGVVLFTRLMVWLRISKLPAGVKWAHIYGLGILAGIGFTMSLFITELAFDNPLYTSEAKVGILTASFIAGLLGYFYLKIVARSQNQKIKKKKREKRPKETSMTGAFG